MSPHDGVVSSLKFPNMKHAIICLSNQPCVTSPVLVAKHITQRCPPFPRFHDTKVWLSRAARVKTTPGPTKHYMTNRCSSQKRRKSFITDQMEQSDPLRLICDFQHHRARGLLTSLKLMSESSGKSGWVSPEPSLVAVPQLSPSLCSPHSPMTHGCGGRCWHRP